jgi:hypothetical protein
MRTTFETASACIGLFVLACSSNTSSRRAATFEETGGSAVESGSGGGLIGTGGNAPINGGSGFFGGGDADTPAPPPMGPFTDFPSTPVVDMSMGATTPGNAPDQFGAAAGGGSGGPCILEPEPDALMPKNWLRPRFRFVPASGQNLFEIRLHAKNEINDLVVYTSQSSWTMPKPMWEAFSAHLLDEPVTLTVRGAVSNGSALTSPPTTSTQTFTIAPVDASGSIVYWSIAGGNDGATSLKGFVVGDESVITALMPTQVQMTTGRGQRVTCIGCHTSTPDGKFAGFTAQDPTWGNAVGSVEAMTAGQQPSFLGAGAVASLGETTLGIQTFSKGHWADGDHVEIAPRGKGASSVLAWFNLEAATAAMGTSYGIISRNGDSRGVAAPAWNHNGDKIVYMSTDAEEDGQPGEGVSDLYVVGYNNRAGGAATGVPGASDPSYNEYYPSFSADDQLIAFDRIASGENMYNQPNAEVFVLPAAGGTATRLVANGPPACSGKTSPGVTNSWPKWSPEAQSVNGKTYYWMIFSSTRNEAGNPQLYLTGVVAQGGNITTHGALYLWNQPANENNHTPAWDVFKIPPVPPPVVN